jgi:hypothetical protein
MCARGISVENAPILHPFSPHSPTGRFASLLMIKRGYAHRPNRRRTHGASLRYGLWLLKNSILLKITEIWGIENVYPNGESRL